MHIELTAVRLDAHPATKQEAIGLVGHLLVVNGYIAPAYIDSMLAREAVANTYLGTGIAIPHGLAQDRALIQTTGIAVLQIPAGLEWNPGEQVSLVFGIAARDDEHLAVLKKLTQLLAEPETVQLLTTTKDPELLLSCLGAASSPESQSQFDDFYQGVEVQLRGSAGLHARPATYFVDWAKRFKSEIHVRYQEQVVNGKSLIALLQLGVESGARFRIMARGEDAPAALLSLQAAVERGLGEEDDEKSNASEEVAPLWEPRDSCTLLPGLSASPGLAIGPLSQIIHKRIIVTSLAKEPDQEEQQLNLAVATAKFELDQIYQNMKSQCGVGKAAIFHAHAEFLDDPELIVASLLLIHKGYTAAWAWQQTIDERAESLERLHDPVLSERAGDLRDVGDRVLRHLAGAVDEETVQPSPVPVIILAEDLSPSDTASLDPTKVLGFCTVAGGPTSHAAIIARSLGLPAVVGAGPGLLDRFEGKMAVLDGSRGILYCDLTDEDLAAAQQMRTILDKQRQQEFLARYQPAITTDSHRIEVTANITTVEEASLAVEAGSEGIGLLRTEFLFLNRKEPPDEEEQYQTFRAMIHALHGLPLTIRILDIGGDKSVPYLHLPAENNPFLGLRGLRLCLFREDLFRSQVRAILRASIHGSVRILLPMVTMLEEVLAAKKLIEEIRLELEVAPVDIGILIEVPAAVAMAEVLAREVTFFSIGTNDLTQYVLAIDRLHPMLTRAADGLHPAVLRMINTTVEAATMASIWVGVCGGIAGDPRGAMILAGLGVTELSVAIPSVAAIKAQIRTMSLQQAQALAHRALNCRTANEVRGLELAPGSGSSGRSRL